jgi:hypothetical protein
LPRAISASSSRCFAHPRGLAISVTSGILNTSVFRIPHRHTAGDAGSPAWPELRQEAPEGERQARAKRAEATTEPRGEPAWGWPPERVARAIDDEAQGALVGLVPLRAHVLDEALGEDREDALEETDLEAIPDPLRVFPAAPDQLTEEAQIPSFIANVRGPRLQCVGAEERPEVAQSIRIAVGRSLPQVDLEVARRP